MTLLGRLPSAAYSEEFICGIVDWVSFDCDLRSEHAIVDAMTETMKCRGPDDRGTWVAKHAALGHRRLAIINPPGGAQPNEGGHPERLGRDGVLRRGGTSPNCARSSTARGTGFALTPIPRLFRTAT
ncbi:MAG: hypothetical protein V7646_2156 [Pseudonocardia sp.]